MIILNVPEMHCENCVRRITEALTAAKLKFSVSLADKTVLIDGDDTAVSLAVSELDDLGFSAERK